MRDFRWSFFAILMLYSILLIQFPSYLSYANQNSSLDRLLTDSLILNLHFNEGGGRIAYDQSGFGNDGIIVGANWVSGISGYALEFDGNGHHYVETPSPDFSTGMLTVSVFVYFNEVPNPLFDYSNAIIAQDQYTRVFQLVVSNGRFCWHQMDGTIESDLLGTDPIEAKKWYHVVATYDGTFHTLYVNGSLNTQLEGTIDFNNAVPINIGRVNWDEFYFNGIIDEVSIYNRALSGEEIASMEVPLYSNNDDILISLIFRIILMISIISLLGLVIYRQRRKMR
jgi:hypothetical protein